DAVKKPRECALVKSLGQLGTVGYGVEMQELLIPEDRPGEMRCVWILDGEIRVEAHVNGKLLFASLRGEVIERLSAHVKGAVAKGTQSLLVGGCFGMNPLQAKQPVVILVAREAAEM